MLGVGKRGNNKKKMIKKYCCQTMQKVCNSLVIYTEPRTEDSKVNKTKYNY